MCREITHIGDSDIGGSEGEVFQLREWRSLRSNPSHPLEEDRCQRSEDLVNSEVRRVRAQNLGARKLREAKSRSAESQHEGHVVELHSGPRNLTSRHASHIWRSQHPVDLSRLRDSGEKGTKVRALDSRSREK
jgi:hypothetical protein